MPPPSLNRTSIILSFLAAKVKGGTGTFIISSSTALLTKGSEAAQILWRNMVFTSSVQQPLKEAREVSTTFSCQYNDAFPRAF